VSESHYRCFIPAAGKLGWARNRPDGTVAVQLDGEGSRQDYWHADHVQRVHLVGPATVGPLAEAA